MASITQSPPRTLVGAYQITPYRVLENGTTGDPPSALEVVISMNGTSLVYRTLYYTPDSVVDNVGVLENRFTIDIADIMQSWFKASNGNGNISLLPPDLTSGVFDNLITDRVSFELFAWTPDVNGFLVKDLLASAVSNELLFINARLYVTDQQDFEQYRESATYSSDYKFLTRKPDNYKVCIDGDEWLYWLSDMNQEVIVKIYDSGGLRVTNTMDVVLPLDYPGETDRLVWIGVGPTSINDLIGQWTTGDFLILETDIYYTVEVVSKAAANVVETRTYYLDNKCCAGDKYTIHFLNSSGVFDTVVSLNSKEENYRTKGSKFAGQREPFSQDDVQIQSRESETGQLQVIGERRITAIFDVSTQAMRDWLYDLFISPNIFIREGTLARPIYIDRGRFSLLDTLKDKAINEVSVTFIRSNKDYSHKN